MGVLQKLDTHNKNLNKRKRMEYEEKKEGNIYRIE